MKTAVVLAGGHGMRLWPLTERIPKPMIAIDSRPIMEFVVATLRASGVRKLLVVLQFNPGPIVEHFGCGDQFGLTIDYLLQEGDLGTAGSVKQAAGFLDEDEDFVVVSSDILFHGDLAEGLEFHHSRAGEATLALSRVGDPSDFGSVSLGEDGRITEFREKPPRGAPCSNVVNAGIYFLNRQVVDRIPSGRPIDFGHEVFPTLIREGARVYGWMLPGYWRDIGTLEGLGAARRDVREISVFKSMMTRWPAPRSGDGGRIWIYQKAPAWEWLEMDVQSIGQAAGLIWKHLAERKEGLSTLSELQKLKGIGSNDALAAVGWLAREGKIQFKQEGRITKVQLSPSELQGAVH